MNRIDECQEVLDTAYLTYCNNRLDDTLICLDKLLEVVLQDDSLKDQPFWKILSGDILKAIVLNSYYNGLQLRITDVETTVSNPEYVMNILSEFCNNFKDNELANQPE